MVDGNKTIKMYGLEIALIIFDDKKFADFCQKQLGDQEVKKSKYNSLLEIKKCQIC